MTEVEICNAALALIGKAAINSLDDPEPAARLCKELYPHALRELQARYRWGYTLTAAKIATQSQASQIPSFRYAHKLPVDYLRFSGLLKPEETDASMLDTSFSSDFNNPMLMSNCLYDRAREVPSVPMRIASGFVHTYFTPICLLYHRHQKKIENMPALFRAALVSWLAARLVFPLTRDVKLMADIRDIAVREISFAQDNEGNDELVEAPQGSSFQEARR